MDETPEDVIRRELGPSEQPLWVGRPRQGLMLRPMDMLVIPFSLLWGGFAIFWEVGVITTGAPLFFAVWGVPFVLLGLYMIIGRFFADAWDRSATTYAVTSERIVIVRTLFGRHVKSLPFDTMKQTSLRERSNGAGTIVFGSNEPYYAWYGPYTSPWWPALPSFELAEEARRVYEIVREAQLTTKRRPASP